MGISDVINPDNNHPKVISVGFMLIDQYSMTAFSSAIEPLRVANQVTGRDLYRCTLWSSDSERCQASNGVEIKVSGSFEEAADLDVLIVCGGIDLHQSDDRILHQVLRHHSYRGTTVGAVYAGTQVLAECGLLEGYWASIHWQNLENSSSSHSNIDVNSNIFEIDRDHFTCAGGTATADMMLALIMRDHGPTIAAQVADMLIHHPIREADNQQRTGSGTEFRIEHPWLLRITEIMEQTYAKPIDAIELANIAGVSKRQLERLFRKYLGISPVKYYLHIRLKQARMMIRQSSEPLLTIVMDCGFHSALIFRKLTLIISGIPLA